MKRKRLTLKEVREIFRLEVICPAKGKFLRGEKRVAFCVGDGELRWWQWENLNTRFRYRSELRCLVKKEFGPDFDIEFKEFSNGYLGHGNGAWFELVTPKVKK